MICPFPVPDSYADTYGVAQMLQRGASIRPHVDAGSPRADVVGTVGLSGVAVVRVGAVELALAPGDAYFLTGPARWDVKHEVLASTEDRLTLTVRFHGS